MVDMTDARYMKIDSCGHCSNSRRKGNDHWYCNPPGGVPWKTVLDGKPILPEVIPLYCPLDTEATICNRKAIETVEKLILDHIDRAPGGIHYCDFLLVLEKLEYLKTQYHLIEGETDAETIEN